MEIDRITIESGIPIPTHVRGDWWRLFSKMDNGDSFKVKTENDRTAAITAAKRAGHLTISAKENGTGFRIWMVKKGKP